MAIESFTSELVAAYSGFLSVLPPFFQSFINLFFLAALIFIYAVFIWNLHKFISTKNILNLNLNQYNKAEHPIIAKIVASGLYLLEYIVIMPLLIFFWFSLFGLFMIIFTDLQIDFILLISAVIVAAIRMVAHYKEPVAREVAKLLPLNLLAISLLVPGFFSFERILGNINQIPGFFSVILYYLLFIVVLETVLRVFELTFSFFGIEN
ncbi:MAG: hypothetical protein AABX50_01800 [Nanoarchaeota archaeon]